MGTPDMLGSYGTYQHFADDGPPEPLDESGGKRCRLTFDGDSATARIVGPMNALDKDPRPLTVEIRVHRDREADGAVIDVQGQRLVLRAGQWSRWTGLRFELPWYDFASVRGIVRFYLREVAPHFRLYVSPVNMDPAAPAMRMSEPESFVRDVAAHLGPFYTTGFQEDYSARKNGVFTDDEYLRQAGIVLEERLARFDHAVDDYDDGLLFFYFSSSNLQSHLFWWDSDARHPTRTGDEVKTYFGHVRRLYRRLDQVAGDLLDRFGSRATPIVMSDHGFANFGRQFNLNSWLRDLGYLGPPTCTSIMRDVDWSVTYAYGLGINGLYLNLKGRERDGIVEPGDKAEQLLAELKERLEAVTDVNGEPVIRNVYRADQIYTGGATALAPDLIVGYRRGYRASWATCLGDLTDEVLLDNDSAWSADHCADALEVPGVLFCNRPLRAASPSLVDVAPSILAEFGLSAPAAMTGKSIFTWKERAAWTGSRSNCGRLRPAPLGHVADDANAGRRRRGGRHGRRPRGRHGQPAGLLRVRAGQGDQAGRRLAAGDAGQGIQDGVPAPVPPPAEGDVPDCLPGARPGGGAAVAGKDAPAAGPHPGPTGGDPPGLRRPPGAAARMARAAGEHDGPPGPLPRPRRTAARAGRARPRVPRRPGRRRGDGERGGPNALPEPHGRR
jgi:hypothetical protein